MPNLTMSIPHNLSRDEVKRRMQEQITHAEQQYGGMIGPVDQRWTGDTLNITAGPVAQRVSGRATVEDKSVKVEVELPWMLGLLAGTIRKQVEQQARLLLGDSSQSKT